MLALSCKVSHKVFNQAARTIRGVGSILLLPALLALIPCLNSQASAGGNKRSDAGGIKVIHAEGEYQASEKPLSAANVISQNPRPCSFATCRP